MGNWIQITPEAIEAKLSGPELNAIRTVAKAPDQEDPVPEAIERVVAEVRGYVAACRENRTSSNVQEIPANLQDAALAMIRYRIASRLPAKSFMTDERVDANRQAIALLKDVAACRFRIPLPDDVSDDQFGGTGVALPKKNKPHFGRDALDGL